MDVDEIAQPQVAAAVALTAAVMSPRVRGWLRKGAVYGIAGALIAGDAVMSFGKGVAEGAQQMTTAAMNAAGEAASPAQPAEGEPGKAGA